MKRLKKRNLFLLLLAAAAALLVFKVFIPDLLLGGCGRVIEESTPTLTPTPEADTTAPTILSVSPTSGATGVATSAVISITFSETMDASTITTSTVILQVKATGAYLAGTVTYESSTRTASFTPASALSSSTSYEAAVSTGVKDSVGNALASAHTWSFTIKTPGAVWTLATANPGFSARQGHASVVFDNKMWVIGGTVDYTVSFNDVWYSADGTTWTRATASTDFAGRSNFGSTAFDNKMWVIGGTTSSSTLADVWYSTDGSSWITAVTTAEFSKRNVFSCLTFNNKMWVIAGQLHDNTLTNEVWYSANGVSWTRAAANPGFSARQGHASVVFDNKMWVIGGSPVADYSSGLNDVWYSTDGVTWTRATASAGFGARTLFGCVVFDNKMWVIGGAANMTAGYYDVWYSTDGASWTRATSNTGMSIIASFPVLSFNGKMWAVGGASGPTSVTSEAWWSN